MCMHLCYYNFQLESYYFEFELHGLDACEWFHSRFLTLKILTNINFSFKFKGNIHIYLTCHFYCSPNVEFGVVVAFMTTSCRGTRALSGSWIRKL